MIQMQKVYLLVKNKYMVLFEKNGNSIERIYVEGNPTYSYDIKNIAGEIRNLTQIIVNEYNLESVAEIQLMVINNENEVIADCVSRATAEVVDAEWKIEEIMETVLQKLSKDDALCIDKYGLNFDGKNYIVTSGEIAKSDFSLLGYPISDDELVKYMF